MTQGGFAGLTKLAIGLLAVLALAACAPHVHEKHPDPTTAPAPQLPTPEPSPEPTESSSEEPRAHSPTPDPLENLSADQERAIETVREFFRIDQQVAQDLNAEIQPLADITDGNMQTAIMQIMADYRRAHAYQRGDVIVHIFDVEEPLEFEDETHYVVHACTDGSAIEMIDARTGKPSEEFTPIPYIKWKLTASDRHGWKIVKGSSVETTNCHRTH